MNKHFFSYQTRKRRTGIGLFYLVLIIIIVSSCKGKHTTKNDKIDILKDTASLQGQKKEGEQLKSEEYSKGGYNPGYKPKNVEISGYIRGAGNANIVLDELSIGGINPLESVVVNEDGSFSVSTVVYEPGLYQLRLPNGGIHLFLRGGKVRVTSDISKLGKYEVVGSKESVQLRDMYYLLDKFSNRTLEIQNRIEDLEKDKSRTKELLRLVDSQDIYYSRITKDKSRELRQFVSNMDTSMIAILAAFYLDPEKNYDFLVSIRNKFSKICPNSKYFKQFSEKIDKVIPLNTGDNVPIVALNNPEGKEISMSTFKGKNMLIYFWAGNNEACIPVTKKLKVIYDRYKNKNFEVYAISFDPSRGSWLDAIQEYKLDWVNVSNTEGMDQDMIRIYKINKIPFMILVNKRGKVEILDVDINQLESKIQMLK